MFIANLHLFTLSATYVKTLIVLVKATKKVLMKVSVDLLGYTCALWFC